MRSTRLVSGRVTNNYDTPDWTSLERLLSSDELCGHFMWMNDALLEDGDVLNAYKHRWTRRYFHLTADARTFNYVGDDTYCEVDPYVAIKAVFAGWEAMLAACECQPTPEERRALRAALRRAKARRESA